MASNKISDKMVDTKKTIAEEIGIVSAVFNTRIHQLLKAGALDELKKAQVQSFKWIEVPGVVEIPLTAKWLFQKNCQVVIALGCVIRGETDHFHSCCRLVEQGCMDVQLRANRPLIFGVLMTNNETQALARSGGKKGHIGRSSVRSALKMLQIKKKIADNY